MSVYALIDPRTSRPRYVGKSRTPKDRYRGHLRHPHSAPLRDWIADLANAGLAPELRILEGGTERKWIQQLGPDLNIAHGQIASSAGQDDIAISVRLPTEVHAEAVLAAKADDRTLNSLVVRAVRVYVEAEKGKRKPGR